MYLIYQSLKIIAKPHNISNFSVAEIELRKATHVTRQMKARIIWEENVKIFTRRGERS